MPSRAPRAFQSTAPSSKSDIRRDVTPDSSSPNGYALDFGDPSPAAPRAPAFTIEGFSDISFDQHSGWALRAGAKYQMTRQWSVEPEYIHWDVGASPVSYETATFTVNGITARQQVGAYEPLNTTDEFAVKLGLRF